MVACVNVSNACCSGLARPSVPALQCLDVLSGAGSCPGATLLVVCALGRYLLRPRWCRAGVSAPGAMVARGVV